MEMERNILGARQRIPPSAHRLALSSFIRDLFPEAGEGLRNSTKLTRALINRGSESSVLMVNVTWQSHKEGAQICVDRGPTGPWPLCGYGDKGR